MNGTPMQLTLRELQRLLRSYRFWAGLAAVAVILAVAGPFGTLHLIGFAERLVYWSVSAFLTFLCGLTVSMYAGLMLHQAGTPEWPARILGGMVAGLPIAITVWVINVYAFNFDMGGIDVFFRVWGSCTAISIAVVIIYFLLNNTNNEEDKTSPFLDRLPVHLGKKLLHVSSQDHYVKAVTSKGSELILMRFSDALKELSNAEGIQIHRAHWVSLNAIQNPVRRESRWFIETIDGEKLPVSRSHSKSVKKALNIK